MRALSGAAGLELSAYREEHVRERIRRALEREGAPDEAALAVLLAADAAARSRFRRSLAVSVTGLFRDPHQFALLEQELLPPLVATGEPLRVWSAGCADGSELASVALLLERQGALARATLLGSDVLDENVEAARTAWPRQGPPACRVRFERRDLVREGPPPGPWDLILCRNVAIYLTAEGRDRCQQQLASLLAPGGVLLLGRSERLARARDLGLEPAGPHAYRRPR